MKPNRLSCHRCLYSLSVIVGIVVILFGRCAVGADKKAGRSGKTKPVGQLDKPAAPTEATSSGAGAIQLQPLELPTPATSFTLSEDGKLLFISHQADDKVTVWDADSKRLLKTLETAAPRTLLSRGDGLYVANFGKGTISYFSSKKDWELVNQFDLDKPNVVHLSAASGKDFHGLILATCHNPGVQGSYQGAVVFAVDTQKDKVTNVGAHALASVTCDGKFVMTQGSFNLSPSGGISFFNVKEFLATKAKPVSQGGIMQTPYTYQVHPSSFWIANNIVFAGSPLVVLKDKDLGNILIPDHAEKIIYALSSNRLVAHRLNTNLTEIGNRPVVFPPETLKKFEGIYHTIYRHRDYLLDHPIAWSTAAELRLFVLDFQRGVLLTATTPAFTGGSAPETPSDAGNTSDVASGDATKSNELGLPFQIAVGKELNVQLVGPANAQYELLTGPDGMKVAPTGTLTWNPKSQQLGVHKLKIRVKDGKSISFARPSIEVLAKDVPPTVASGGTDQKFERIDLDADRIELTPGKDYHSLLLLQGDRLRVLALDGINVKQDIQLPQRYHRIAERDDYYVAISAQPAQLDLVDKKSHTVQKSIRIDQARVNVMEVMDLALHPKQPVSFISIKHDIDLPSYRIVVINEANGSCEAPESMYGTWVEVDPAGNYLYAGYKDIYSKGSTFHINPGWKLVETPQYGNIDWLITYDIHGRTPKFKEMDAKAGGNGYGIRMSADGQRITYLSHVGTPQFSKNLLGWNPAKLAETPVTYPTNGVAVTTQLAFHPTLKIVAVPGGTSAVLFDRETGKPLENRLQLSAAGLGGAKVEDLIFSPDGKSLLFVCNAGADGRYLRRVGLRLDKDELTTSAKGVVAPVEKVVPKPQPISLKEFDALVARPETNAMSPKEINRRYSNSVVLVKSEEGSGTGFIVGKHGYILTCAHVLPGNGEVTITYVSGPSGREKAGLAKASVLLRDDDQDLALLKVPAKSDLPTVTLADTQTIEAGEEATIIGNPGLGGAILTQTLTTGVVSNSAREIDGQTYIQTSAAVNPGTSGGPMFNSRGDVIGIVVLKAKIEGAAFATPATTLRTFLERCQAPAE